MLATTLPIPCPGDLLDLGWTDGSVVTGTNHVQAISFQRRMVSARAVSADGSILIEFDARIVLEKANADLLRILADEWFCGDGPGCRRLLELAGPDAQTFLTLTELKQLDWTLNVDARQATAWLEAQRPQLINLIDPDMVSG